jgi:hypothetical protein
MFHEYTCHSCQDPVKVLIGFGQYIISNGPQRQKCQRCGAIHLVSEHKVELLVPGTLIAKLSPVYEYPEYSPFRAGPYRVRYSNGNWSKNLVSWNGENWHNGPVLFREGSIVAWQGLAGDMEHLKEMPYEHAAPLPDLPTVPGDE